MLGQINWISRLLWLNLRDISQVIEHSCYTFNGEGYSVQRDLRNYDPRYLSISMEVKSFDPDALIFFAVNEYQVTHSEVLLVILKP